MISSQYIDLSFNSFAIEGWFKADVLPGAGNYPHIFGIKEGGSDGALVRINGDSEKLEFVMQSEAGWKTVTSSETIQAGIWYHAAVLLHKGASDTQYLLINGEIVAWQSYATINNYSNREFCIGGDGNRNFDGQVDDVKVWNNIARSSQDVRTSMYKQLVGNESNLVAYYKLDETSGTTVDNAEGTASYDGTLTNMAGNEWMTSPAFFGPKNCLDFDGDNDYVDCGNDASLQIGGSNITLEAWINVDVFETNHFEGTIIDKHGGTFEGYGLRCGGSGILDFNLGNGTTWYSTSSPANTLTAATWHHVAGTYDGTIQKLYVDGVLVASTTISSTISANTSNNLYLGESDEYSGRFIDGKMDEVRIWSTTRTEAEIRENMFKNLVGDESNLVAYYNLDNTSGSVAQSYPAEANDGTLTNMTGTYWVTSTAFNTWLNTDDTDWTNAANWGDGVPASTDNIGIYNYSGLSPTLSNTPTVNNIFIGTSAGLTLSSGLTVNDNLFLNDNLDLNGQTITLGSSATLYEDNGLISGTTGTITTTRNLSGITAENVAGLGATITTAADMGSTTITRGHTVQTHNSNNSIKRYFDITPATNTGLNASLTFNYEDGELNGLTESNLKMFKYDGVSNWTNEGGLLDMDANTISLIGLDGFSKWTAVEDLTLSLAENIIKGFSMYPNPTKDILNITAREEIKQVKIFNSMGHN